MAYSAARFNMNASGMTGRGAIAVYDGTGTDAEGGDTLARIKAPGFFPLSRGAVNPMVASNAPSEVLDAVQQASRRDGPRVGQVAGSDDASGAETWTLDGGEGLPIVIQARNGTEVDLLYHRVEAGPPPVDRLELRGGRWNLT